MVSLGGCLAIVCGALLILNAPSTATRCGKRKAAARSSGNWLVWKGRESKDGYWPWHVALWRSKGGTINYICGGTILNRNVILTAAHCLQTPLGPISREHIVVQVGRSQLKIADDRTKEHEVHAVFIHPDYSSNTVVGDIALIKLATDITYTKYIQPICLWNDALPPIVGQRGFVVGFGIDESNRSAGPLREAQLPVVDNFKCVKSNPAFYGETLTENMFCAGDRNGTSACNGDSGGGLFFLYDGIWYIRGIVSFTKSRQVDDVVYLICDPNEYTVFTHVSKYLSWIVKTSVLSEISPVIDNSPKLQLLNLNTCGSNAYPYLEEALKPVFLGYPWVGVLEYSGKGKRRICHATLISERYLITNANCVVDLPSSYKLSTVRLGEYDKSTSNDCEMIGGKMECAPPIQTLRVESIIVHPFFKMSSFAYDIALVRLRDLADVSNRNVKPICLPVSKQLRSLKPSVLTLTAWERSRNATKIERTALKVIDSVECQQQYNEVSIKFEKSLNEICAKELEESDRKCHKPAGGAPLQVIQNVRGSLRYVLHGMLSFGAYKCNTAFPNIYTNVGSFMEWILSNIEE